MLGLRWEYNHMTRIRNQTAGKSTEDDEDDSQKVSQPPAVGNTPKTHTEWGYQLVGDPQFWSKAKINCKDPSGKFYMEDLKLHNSEKSIYLTMQGYVFDVTMFVPNHPGGEAIFGGAEQDASEIFELHHQEFVSNMLGNFCIGKMYPSVDKPSKKEEKVQSDSSSDMEVVENGKKTPWGAPLHGSDSFWSSVEIKCKDDSGHFTMGDIQEHSTSDSLYLTIRGFVLDVTKFLPNHPGGEAILEGAKADASALFESHHQTFVGGMLGNFCIGKLYPE
eukprot:TRINITY_DN10060_c0_g2_i2.p1 TRINITY_DN10060_c0_g2~~TRINITY_DN10060_c0_g2_i2.p1  ORF type:complete len:276 (+),score=67.60 TRINITY_DN10060_c0_g2_i2:118-945(+)